MEPIYVTKTFMPPIEEFQELLEEVWRSHLVTNDGPLFQRFEKALRDFTGIEHLVCVGNGTLALQLAVRALGLTGEVITTPFTHVAGSDCLVWEGCTPVYVDIDPETLNIDPKRIEEKLTDRTTGIVGVHVYSNPCDVEAIEEIAQRHGLKVIFDGAHAFGVRYKDRSVFAYGDLSMASFNATKAFHTMEGGALFSRNADMVKAVRRLAYYGMDENKVIVQRYGMNAKLIELCAAMGLVNLRYFEAATQRRKEAYELYLALLGGNPRIRFQKLTGEINYSYMPIILESEDCKKKLLRGLQRKLIYPREYFYPSLETLFAERVVCTVAYDVSHRVLCLPMSDYITETDVKRICEVINNEV
jgi:dTDP-4-amino-4,6-dideoxygalactose transaminase